MMKEHEYGFLSFLINEEVYIIGNQTLEKKETMDFSGTVVIVDYPGLPDLPSKEKLFLYKILESAGLELNSVRIINMSAIMHDISKISIQFRDVKLLLFTDAIPALFTRFAQIEKYKMETFSDGRVLLADPLEDLETDVNKKRKLWESLKLLFNLKI